MVDNSAHEALSSILVQPGTISPTFNIQANLDGSYYKVATRTAITISSTQLGLQIQVPASTTGVWKSLDEPVETSISPNTGRRSFKLKGEALGNYLVTATSSGYLTVSVPVTIGFPPPPPPPAPKPVKASPVKNPYVPPAPLPAPPPEVTPEPAPVVQEEVQAFEETNLEVPPVEIEMPRAELHNPWQVLGASTSRDASSYLEQLLTWLRSVLIDIIRL